MSVSDRVCILSFDECSIAREWSYDKGSDILYAPKRKVQCVMIRGLMSSWKQIVFYDFDTDMTKPLLFNLITEIELAGFPVVAIVNDPGPTNVRLWKTLGICIDNSNFENPASPDRYIFVFADAPHLMKLIRNNFLDHGFQLSDGNYVHSGPVNELIKRSKSDLKTSYKLSERHINVSGLQRMNVKLAVQLISETTAKSLQYFGSKGLFLDKHWEKTSQFISLTDSWFDLFNSRVPRDRKISRNAYGLNLENQNEILKCMTETVKSMKVIGSKSLYPFQKGLLVSSESLPKLQEMVKEKFDISYLLTYRLNQDGLEHFFACLRQMGACYQHPSAVAVKHRVRSHLLGKDSYLMGSKYNTESDCKGDNLTAGTFSFLDDDTPSQDNDDESLQRELSLSAMIFCLPDECDGEGKENDVTKSLEVENEQLEDAVERGGLEYFAGFIAHKFPKYANLGSYVTMVSRL